MPTKFEFRKFAFNKQYCCQGNFKVVVRKRYPALCYKIINQSEFLNCYILLNLKMSLFQQLSFKRLHLHRYLLYMYNHWKLYSIKLSVWPNLLQFINVKMFQIKTSNFDFFTQLFKPFFFYSHGHFENNLLSCKADIVRANLKSIFQKTFIDYCSSTHDL